MMETEEATKSGELYAPSQGFLKKSWHKRFYALYKASKHGIQRLEVFDTEDNFYRQSPSKIIPLTDCIKVTPAPQKQQANVFEIRRKNHAYLYSAETYQEMTEWVSAIQEAAFGPTRPTSAVSLGGVLTEGISNAISEVKQEENMLYSSVDAPEMYQIKMIESEASVRCGLHGEYRLLVTPVNISLAEEGSSGQLGRILYAWPYRHIRRYGCSKEVFSLEAGRKCSSGEGLFCFEAKDGMLIFQSVASHVSSLKASQNEMDLQASPSPNSEQTFFGSSSRQSFPYPESGVRLSPALTRQGVLSDSPKSISKESINNVQDSESTSSSTHTKRADSISAPVPDSSGKQPLKPTPPISKPPRKSKSTKGGDSESSSQGSIYELITAGGNKVSPPDPMYEDPIFVEKTAVNPQPTEVLYDEPQELTDAWKLYGRDVDETEGEVTGSQPSSSPEPLYAVLEEDAALKEQIIQLSAELKQKLTPEAMQIPEVHSKITPETDNYDHLGVKKPSSLRFASLNPENQHVYGKLVSPKQSNPSPIACKQPVVPRNEYTNVNTPQYAVSSSNQLSQQTKEATLVVPVNSASKAGVGNYENIAFLLGPKDSPATTTTDPKQDLTPAHFVHNEVEYAQVQKRTTK